MSSSPSESKGVSFFPLRARHPKPLRRALFAVLVLSAFALPAHATFIGSWDFGAGNGSDSSGSPTPHDLATTGAGVSFINSTAVFSGNEAAPSYLEVAGPGGSVDWTISLSVRSDGVLDQGTFQGIFSNNNSSTAAFSWQVESHSGVYQWRNQAGTFAIGTSGGVGTWDHIVIRKFGGNDGDIWFNGVQVVASIGANPGGLQNFRLGTNRNTNRFWAGALDDVRAYDSVEDPATLFAASRLPEPVTAALLALGGIALARRR